MAVNTFNFALKWALVILGIDLLTATIPAIIFISDGMSKPAIFVMLSGLFMVAKFIVFTMAIIQFGRATQNKLPPSEMWLFGGLMYILMTLLGWASKIAIKATTSGEQALSSAFEEPPILSIGFGLLVGMLLLTMAMLLAGRWRTFEKAGKPGWACIVPIYNWITEAEIAQKPVWWVAMLFIPLVNIVFFIMLLNGVSKAFGKDEGWTVGLLFLPFVFYPMLAWGDAKYLHQEFDGNDGLAFEDHLVE